jgi:serine/threonine protein kinase
MLQDIKSPNVLLSADCTAKIADVGLAKMQNQTFLSVNQEAIGVCCTSVPFLPETT